MIYIIAILILWTAIGAYWAYRTDCFFDDDLPLIHKIMDRIICLPFLFVTAIAIFF